MSRKPDNLPGWPGALSEVWAADYLSLGMTTFRREVAAKRIPQPVWLTEGRKAWIRRELDEWLDAKRGDPSEYGAQAAADPSAMWDAALDGTCAT